MADSGEITRLLQAGDGESLGKLFPLVYDELKSLANSLFRRERANHTLQPTALVHRPFGKPAAPNRNANAPNGVLTKCGGWQILSCLNSTTKF